jgi:hypothetical protein
MREGGPSGELLVRQSPCTREELDWTGRSDEWYANESDRNCVGRIDDLPDDEREMLVETFRVWQETVMRRCAVSPRG